MTILAFVGYVNDDNYVFIDPAQLNAHILQMTLEGLEAML